MARTAIMNNGAAFTLAKCSVIYGGSRINVGADLNHRVISQRGFVAERGVSDFRVAADETAFADDRIADFGGLPYARAGQQHGILYPRAFFDDAVRAERRVDDFDAGFEHAARIDHRARVNPDGLDLSLVYSQDGPRHIERLQSSVDQVFIGLQVALRRA